MRDYDELIKDLREYAELVDHDMWDCPYMIADSMKQAADAIEDLIAALTASNEVIAKNKPKWISVEERLPEENKAVNIVWINRSPVIYYQDIKDIPQSATGVYYKGQWYWWSAVVQDYLAEYGKWEFDKMDDAIEVTHWMPLPEPPREDKP